MPAWHPGRGVLGLIGMAAGTASPSPYCLTGDTDGRWPLVLASPHSGRHYPAALLAGTRLTLAQLRRAEDALVDALLDGIAGVPVLAATHARCWIDLNRRPDELDPALFDGPLAVPVALTDRVQAGLGVIPRLAGLGLEIHARPLPAAEAAARLTGLHAPWHARIAGLMAAACQRHGSALLIDCHSMPSPGGPRPPQIVLGDCHGQSAHPAIVQAIEDHFRRAGWRVARNTPYAGGHTTRAHGRPGLGLHAVQIEIDRALYLDSQRLTLHAGAGKVRAAMTALVQRLVADWPHLAGTTGWQEAAE